jgi:aspartyl-tRNA(Asn)/glutamyl-tRNA(Gln) amidotransferase subunit B
MLREIGVSDCEMQEGSLRCDANVNVHIPEADGSVAATPLVEVKNLNSITAVGKAIAYEAERQYREFQKDPQNYRFGKITKTTAGWNDVRGITEVQRHKEEAADYRYFPDPDLVPVVISKQQISEARQAMGELPSQQRQRLQADPYGLSAYDARVLTAQGRKVVSYFETVARQSSDAKSAVNWVANEVLASLKERGEEIDQFPIAAERLAGLIGEVKSSGLKREKAREVYNHMLEHGSDASTAIGKLGFQVVSDEGQLRELIGRAIAANPQAAADFKNGKIKAADRIKGAVMKETKGLARADLVEKLMLEELSKK